MFRCGNAVSFRESKFWKGMLGETICARVQTPYIGDGHPTFNRNPYNGYINPYYWVEFPIPYYMEIMGVDRPWHISKVVPTNLRNTP